MTDPTRLIDRYLDGTLTQEELAELEQDLATNVNYADAFAHVMMIDWLLADRIERDAITSTMQLGDGQFLGEADLKILQDDYDLAEVQPVSLDDQRPIHIGRENNEKDDGLSFSEAAWAISYGIKCLVRAKPAPFITTGLAAMLLITLWLINPFASDAPDAPEFTDNTPFQMPAASTESTPRGSDLQAVATLTATHNATWASPQAEGALARGSELHPNQRLTLTAGFAEITTKRGAIAILEAPATIELIDNDNAIRLHTGKLVGICETAASKGFLVRTPHMDITDLGTRFGVMVDPRLGGTLAEVFDGKIAVKPADLSQQTGPAVELTRGQSIAMDAAGQAISIEQVADNAFGQLRDLATGVVLSGQVQWSSTAPGVMRPKQWPTSDDVMLYTELSGYRLPEAVRTDMNTDKTLTWPVINPAAPIPAGTVVRTYVLAFHPGQGDRVQAFGSVRFEGEILGVTTAEKSWNDFIQTAQDASDQLYTFEPEGPRNLFPEVDLDSRDQRGVRDKLWLSEDARTLNVEVTGRDFAELMRVIVLEPIDEPFTN